MMNIISKFKTVFNLIILNLKIIYQKYVLKKKIILFYYPKSKQIFENIFYIEDLFDNYNKDIKIFFLHQDNSLIKKNYYYILESKLNLIFNSDLFISNFICDNFPQNIQKIYIHHNLYDDPWVSIKKEKETCIRLKNYNFIFVASSEAKKGTISMFQKNLIKSPTIKEVGYHKLDYLLKKKIKKKNNLEHVLIAPTGINGFTKLSMCKDLKVIIKMIFTRTKYKVILRPHPRDRNNKIYKQINFKFKNNGRYEYDTSANYYKTYIKSKFMITDISGTAYTYSFLTLSPVIFYSMSEKRVKKYNYSDLKFFKDRNKIGTIVKSHTKLISQVTLLEKKYLNFRKSSLILRKKLKYLNKSKYIIKEIVNNVI